ncbi:MAG: prohibitin family protein [Ruminococcaceae bacterium]|nr:prohibitin family protein [Oscillospiraceae bacterium]
MIQFVIGMIILLAGIFGGIFFFSYKKVITKEKSKGVPAKDEMGNPIQTVTTPLRKFSLLTVFSGVVLAGVIIFLGCMASVPTGHTGVLTTFGKVESETYDAGFNIKAPWQKVVMMDNRVQKASANLACFSSDIQEVSILYTLNYQIDKSNAQEIYKTVGISYYDTIIVPNIAEAVKVVTARYNAEELISSRADLAIAIENVLKKSLEKYNIQVVSAAIEDMDFTDAFTNAVEAKQVAAQNKLQAEIEQAQKVMEQEAQAQMAVIQANAAAETAKIQAEADLEVAKIQADAAEYAGQKDAAVNKAIAESITEELLQYYYIQQWDGKLPSTYVGSEDASTIITGAVGSEQQK